jgi:regulator of protease activity HflC (stomatin/prohibitin superfamily)
MGTDDQNKFKLPLSVKVGLIIVTIIGLLLLVILLPLSFTYVEYDEYAFKKSTVDNKVDTGKTYKTGRYFWGLTRTAVTFPSTYQYITYRERDVQVFSADGLVFNLDVDIYYKLEEENLPNIFKTYGLLWKDRLIDTIKAALKNKAAEYTVDEYIRNRTQLSGEFLTRLNDDLSKMFIGVKPFKLMLLYFEFPESLRSKFLSTAVQELLNDKALLQQEVELINAETSRLVEEVKANITIINENGHTTADAIIQNAQAQANNLELNALGDGLADLFAELEMDNSTDRKKLFDLMTILDSKSDSKVLVGPFGNIIIGH